MSNVTPLEVAGIVARVFDIDPKEMATRLIGKHKSWPRPLAARAVAARLIEAHTTASKRSIQALFGLDGAYRNMAEADFRLSAEMKADPNLRDLVGKAEYEIDKLHEAREEAREATLRERARSDAAKSYARGKSASHGADAPSKGART